MRPACSRRAPPHNLRSCHRRFELVKVLHHEIRLRPQGVEGDPGAIDPADLEPEALGAQDVEGVGGDEEDLLFLQPHRAGGELVDLGRSTRSLNRAQNCQVLEENLSIST